MFYKIINTAVNSTFSKKVNVKGKSNFPINKWFNKECKNIKTQVNNYAKHYDISKPSFSEIYHRLECEYKRIIQKYKREYRNTVILKINNFHSVRPDAHGKLWKSLNLIQINNSNLTIDQFVSYCQGQVKPPPTDYFDVYHMTEIQHIVNSYNVGPEEDITSFNLNMSDAICNSPITIEEIKTHLTKLKNKKAAGADGLCGECFKYVSDDLAPTLYALFNGIFDRG